MQSSIDRIVEHKSEIVRAVLKHIEIFRSHIKNPTIFFIYNILYNKIL